MPSRKQRRRRSKGRRHEYEYVYVDDEGREVEVDEEELEAEKPTKQAAARGGSSGRGGRPARTVPPPSWRRVGRRLLIFVPLMFLLFSFTSEGVPLVARIVYTGAYAALFAPFLYYVDRWAYRRYLRASGRDPDEPAPARANGRRR